MMMTVTDSIAPPPSAVSPAARALSAGEATGREPNHRVGDYS